MGSAKMIAIAKMIGGGGAIGEFSKYEKVKVKFPNAANNNSYASGANVELPFDPKIIVFSSDKDDIDGHIIKGIFAFDVPATLNAGIVFYRALSTGLVTNIKYDENSAASSGVCMFRINDGKFEATRASGNGYWSNSYDYTFEFYG